MANGTTWTSEQEVLARKMLNRRATDAEFREALGKSKYAVRARIDRENSKLRRAKKPPVRVQSDQTFVPPAVLADLEFRKNSQRSLTAILMGDPEPGRRKL